MDIEITEADWLDVSCGLHHRIDYLISKKLNSPRKLIQLASSIYRRHWDWLVDPRNRLVIECMEKIADDPASIQDLHQAIPAAIEAARELDEQELLDDELGYYEALGRAEMAHLVTLAPLILNEECWRTQNFNGLSLFQTPNSNCIADLGNDISSFVGLNARRITKSDDAENSGIEAEEYAHALLAMEIFGNPFRQVQFDDGWRTSAVMTIAEQIYQSRDFACMPILADVLAEAGCNNEEVVSHCLSGGQHVLGCWALDLILAKS